jgi:CheY-like chemotaxis protein
MIKILLDQGLPHSAARIRINKLPIGRKGKVRAIMNAHGTDRRHLDLIAVEDSAVDLELEVDALREARLLVNVRRAEDEPAFRAALTERLPDAILADWTLPAFTGQRALEIAQEYSPRYPCWSFQAPFRRHPRSKPCATAPSITTSSMNCKGLHPA